MGFKPHCCTQTHFKGSHAGTCNEGSPTPGQYLTSRESSSQSPALIVTRICIKGGWLRQSIGKLTNQKSRYADQWGISMYWYTQTSWEERLSFGETSHQDGTLVRKGNYGKGMPFTAVCILMNILCILFFLTYYFLLWYKTIDRCLCIR